MRKSKRKPSIRGKWGKILIPLVFILVIVFIKFPPSLFSPSTSDQPFLATPSNSQPRRQPSEPVPTQQIIDLSTSASLFVPYWTVKNDSILSLPSPITHSKTDFLIYFGIAPTAQGIDTSEPGYNNLETFTQATQHNPEQKLLTVRMTNEDINTTILTTSGVKQAVITDTIEIMNTFGFDGILVDLEHSVLPTQKTIDAITLFMADFSEAARNEGKIFGITIFGDTLYRQRPYDLKALEPHLDYAFVMAYDFHKSFGEPGPNFPLNKGDQYAYDFKTMIGDLSSVLTTQKMVVLFGFFGYDWSVDGENRPLKGAVPLTLNQIRSKFIDSCEFTACDIHHDSISSETQITYTDSENNLHVVWFEDEASTQEKIDYLKTQGISHIGYWAWGYY